MSETEHTQQGQTEPYLGADPASSAQTSGAARIGRFEVRKELGAGAFGRVLLAFDPQMNRLVAIKQPFGEGLRPEYRADFLKEARAAAAIDQHPNVCPVYDVTADGDAPYLVMRFVAGGTLRQILQRTSPLTARTALGVARKLALGLAAAHAKGVIHRDLKPANVLYDDANREVLLTDFGLARIFAPGSDTATINRGAHGTPLYMPPEQWGTAAFGPITPRADLYSLGVILYQMLCGRAPFSGAGFELMTQHCTVPPDPPSVARPELGTRFDALCLKALEKNPADRYASAKEFADALAALLRGPVGAPAPDANAVTTSVPDRSPEPPSAPVPAVPVTRTAEVKTEPTLPPGASTVSSSRAVPVAPPMLDSPHRAAEEQNVTAARLGVGLARTNSVGVHFRLIPAGEFRAGPTPDDPTARPGARQVRVTIDRPLWAAVFPLTNRIVSAFLDDPGPERQIAADRLFAPGARGGGADDLPATHISALDALALCRWLNRIDAGHGYRLPTEAEWEFLARAGREAAVHPSKAPPAPAAGPSAPDTRRANPFGLLDVLGNVSEWTCTPFAFSADAAALKVSAPVGGANALTVRGGSWRCKPDDLTLAWRRSVTATRRADDLGVRLVCEVAREDGAGNE
ncbi:MAG TPA: bifunctional serine/threonine-protein kinase/formylglycine-generating enzyme family protein [Gemmata sp.]